MKEIFSSSCYFNHCTGSLSQLQFLSQIYMVFFLLLLAFLILSIVKRTDIRENNLFLSKLLIATLLIFVIGQTFFNVLHFTVESRFYAPWVSLSDQYKRDFDKKYLFAEKAKELVPHGCQATYVSDYDVKTPSGEQTKYFLGYFIYPIDIRMNIPDRETSCFVAFSKRDPEKSVPPGYRILLKYDKTTLLAVKDE